ncbi:hypothetical protein ACFOPS_08155 [Ralstonia solanacearum]|uniref:hypothetical protein n=1 Tax=Ralstonia solanacearum TaxID=305 RepID=UPI003613F29B
MCAAAEDFASAATVARRCGACSTIRWEIRIERITPLPRRDKVDCATTARPWPARTWITEDVIQADTALHPPRLRAQRGNLVRGQACGGLYEWRVGHMFYGESMSRTARCPKIRAGALCASSLFPLGSRASR